MRIESWITRQAGEPMVREERLEEPGPGEVIVRVAGCGVCHTDLGYYYDGVATRHGFPLTLGHEVSGTVECAGDDASDWMGKDVIIPAVIPCGSCAACEQGRGSICKRQIFPGNDVHGGFGSHLRVPAVGLCPVPDLTDPRLNPSGLELAALSVIADAVSTPYQAILRSGLSEGDLAVFVGVGGVGGFGAQIAATMGAVVIAIDVSDERLELASSHGASLTLRSDSDDLKGLRRRVRAFARERGIDSWHQKVFETSGNPNGQQAAFSLLGPGGYLSIVGYTPKPVTLALSNLMAFDATAQGNWGCLPQHYPAVLELVLGGRVSLTPFIEYRAMHTINETFSALHHGSASRRPILIPES